MIVSTNPAALGSFWSRPAADLWLHLTLVTWLAPHSTHNCSVDLAHQLQPISCLTSAETTYWPRLALDHPFRRLPVPYRDASPADLPFDEVGAFSPLATRSPSDTLIISSALCASCKWFAFDVIVPFGSRVLRLLPPHIFLFAPTGASLSSQLEA